MKIRPDGRGEGRFSSRAKIDIKQRLERAEDQITVFPDHGLSAVTLDRAIAAAERNGLRLEGDQQAALSHVTRRADFAIVTGYAGTGKSAMLRVARDGWERAALCAQGAALQAIATDNLERIGYRVRTLASLEHQWGQGCELLHPRSSLVSEKGGMIGWRQRKGSLPKPRSAAPRSRWSTIRTIAGDRGERGVTIAATL